MQCALLLTTFLVLSLCWQDANAQSDEESQFLLKSPLNFSGFGAPVYEFSGINGDFTAATGGGGALLINQQIFIGLYRLGSNQHTPVVINDVQFDQTRLHFRYGGLWLGYIHRSHALIHYGVSTKLGGGNIELTDEDVLLSGEEREIGQEQVFVFTPQVEVEINVLKWLKLNAGLGYRVVTEVDMAFGHGGLWLGYIHQSQRFLHAGLSLEMGGGGAVLASREDNEFIFEDSCWHQFI